MRMLRRVVSGLALSVLAATAAAGATLSADQIVKLFSGTTIATRTNRGNLPFTIIFNSDFTLEGRVEHHRRVETDKGKWWTFNDRLLCWQFDRFGQNRRRCVTVERDGEKIVRKRADNGGPVPGAEWIVAHQGANASLAASAGPAPPAMRPSAPSTGASAPGLAAEQIVALLTGTTVAFVPPATGNPTSLAFRDGGALHGEQQGASRVPSDDGRWWTDPRGLVCWQFNRWAGGRKFCNRIVRNRDRIERRIPTGDRPAPGEDWKIVREGPRTASVASTSWSGLPVQAASARPVVPAQTPDKSPDKAPPTITVPATLTADSGVVQIDGKVSDRSKIVEVTVNARPVSLGRDGSFSIRRGVPHGTTAIVVAALDEWGNRASRKITVTRPLPPAPPQPAVGESAESYADIHFGNYYALVIGNNKYRRLTGLRTAEQDARAVAKVLKHSYGFKVRLLLNATRGDLIGALADFRAKLTPNDNLLIYYAGHGELDEVAEQGYWLPVDAETNVPTNWVSTSDITVMVRAIRAKHILVVADSCYSGTLVRDADIHIKTATARHAWLERMAEKRARTALVSGGLEPVLDGGGGGHSVFAKAFIDALRENKGILDGESLFDQIKRPVVVNSSQTPEYSDIRNAGHEGGDFLFVHR